MEHIWQKIDELRTQYPVLREDSTPIDVFSFAEIDLKLDPIPFDDLLAKYRVEAAIKADFTGIYLDAEQYKLMERGPEWKLNRLRFSLAHELAHFFLHRDLPQAEHFASLPDFARWTQNYGGRKYTTEQEANEFAGRLLVPKARLQAYFDEFEAKVKDPIPNFITSGQLRDQFAEKIGPRFGVNSQVIGVRLDRDSLWSVS
ncbi:MAG: ImmA/IrrE family metallo-endopeptidase [Verrucomicrobiota bacterium]